MTNSRIWNRRFPDGNAKRRAGSQRHPITSSREDRHTTCMALMDRAATSRRLSQELGSFARQQRRCITDRSVLNSVNDESGCTNAQRNPTFQQDKARPHVTGIVLTFLHKVNARLFPLPARSPDFSSIKNVLSLVAERLACHHTAVTTVDELWHRVEAARASVPEHSIQSLFDSMPRHISAVIIARGGCSEY
ncbi:transposable element Tcb1 transposase [Trichonephila clavipes]|nr:transposable element Tcb1 transposase [Trichonephila clavipes]